MSEEDNDVNPSVLQTDAFSSLMVSLQGVRILEKPRVSREVIIFVLKEHTEMMREFRQELSSFSEVSKNLLVEAGENRKAVASMLRDVEENRMNIQSLERKVFSLHEDVAEIKEKISEFAVIKQVLKEHKVELNEVDTRIKLMTAEMKHQNDAAGHALGALETKSNETFFLLKELQHRVDHFGDNLTLSSSQIIVESSVGFANRPLSLLETLKLCHENFSNLDLISKRHEGDITAHTEAIDTKADATLAVTVEELSTNMAAVKEHLKKEEKQGINAIRKVCDELTVAVEGMQGEMSGKMDRNAVDIIIHRKYEDIVEYLQEALQATAEDEDNFKNTAKQLQEAVNKLVGSKADRLEIQPMQEALVKFESVLMKLGGQSSKEKTKQNKEGISKQELDALLELKLDKSEFEAQIQVLSRTRRDRRNIPGMGMGMVSNVEDAVNRPGGTDSDTKPAIQNEKDKRDALMWKGLADAMKDESEQALVRGIAGPGGGGGGGVGVGGGGGVGGAVSFGVPLIGPELTQQNSSIGRGPRRSRGRKPSTGLPSHQLAQQQQLVMQQQQQQQQTLVLSASSPGFPTSVPGQFRQATEAGRSGGGIGVGVGIGIAQHVSTGSLGFLPPTQATRAAPAPVSQFGPARIEEKWPAGKYWEHGRDPANGKMYEHGGPKPIRKRRTATSSSGQGQGQDSDDGMGQDFDSVNADEDGGGGEALVGYTHLPTGYVGQDDSYYASTSGGRYPADEYSPGSPNSARRHTPSNPNESAGGVSESSGGFGGDGGPVLGGGFSLASANNMRSQKGRATKEGPGAMQDTDMVVKGADGKFYYTDDDPK